VKPEAILRVISDIGLSNQEHANKRGIKAFLPAGKSEWQRWTIVLYLWGAFFLAYIGRQSMFSIFPVLRRELGFTEVQLGLTGTVFLWVYALANPLGGRLSDRWSKKVLVIAAILSWSVCTLMIGVTQSPSGLLAWRAALAFAQALYFPAAVALISHLHSEYTRSTALSLHGSAQFVGVIFGGWYGGFATEVLGWRWMLWILAAATTVYGLVLYLRLEDKQPPAHTAAPSSADDGSGSTSVFTPTYLALCISFFAICAMIWLIYAWLPDIVRGKFNLPLGTASLIATAYAQVAMIAGLVCAAPLGDRLMKQTKRGRLYVMLVGLIGCSPFLHILVRCQTLEGVRLAALGYGFFTGLFTANFLACVFDVVPKGKRGFAAGFANMIGGIAGGLSAYLVGLLKGRYSVEVMFSVAAGFGIVSAILLLATVWLLFLRDYGRAHPEMAPAAAGSRGLDR
jgi:MFS family permease